MAEMTHIVIGVQARSTSQRLPRKVHELLDKRPVLQHVLSACDSAAKYISNRAHLNGVIASVALLIPSGDEIGYTYRNHMLIEGDEQDVLSRYVSLNAQVKADYVVRVTGDCPLIPPFLIQKHVQLATSNRYDYVSNASYDSRTSPDGHDCEVMSARMLKYLDENAKGEDREHVTSLIRRTPPEWCNEGAVIGHLPLAGVKLSVDTLEDLERVREYYFAVKQAVQNAEGRLGKGHVHRY